MRGYPAWHAAQQVKALARDRLPAVAVDGKTSRGARRTDDTRVHLLGAAEHGGHLLDHLEVDARHNETSHLSALLEPMDLDGTVVTFDALHTVRANLNWLPAATTRLIRLPQARHAVFRDRPDLAFPAVMDFLQDINHRRTI